MSEYDSQSDSRPGARSGSRPGAGSAAPGSSAPPPPFIAVSALLRRLTQQVEITSAQVRLAVFEGEAGAGKFLLAQQLHHRSPLGHLALVRQDAREWLANDPDIAALSGTLYLDRVDLLTVQGQTLLLNFLKALQNLDPARSGLRFLFLASSHVSLRQMAAQGHLLPDLAFRLTSVRFAVPPLRDHREDIAPLAQALVERICRRYQQPLAVLGPGCLPRLLQHPWPGNVRELAGVLESAILESASGVLRPGDLSLQAIPAPRPQDLATSPLAEDLSLDAAIRRHIQLVLELNRGNKLRASRQLGISRSTLYRILDNSTDNNLGNGLDARLDSGR